MTVELQIREEPPARTAGAQRSHSCRSQKWMPTQNAACALTRPRSHTYSTDARLMYAHACHARFSFILLTPLKFKVKPFIIQGPNKAANERLQVARCRINPRLWRLSLHELAYLEVRRTADQTQRPNGEAAPAFLSPRPLRSTAAAGRSSARPTNPDHSIRPVCTGIHVHCRLWSQRRTHPHHYPVKLRLDQDTCYGEFKRLAGTGHIHETCA